MTYSTCMSHDIYTVHSIFNLVLLHGDILFNISKKYIKNIINL